MNLGREEADNLVRSGVAALQRGDAGEAQRLFDMVVEQGGALPKPWFFLAQACRQTGDKPREIEALDRTLAEQPRNVGALIMRGDLYDGDGDDRAAVSFYRNALNAVAELGQVSPMIRLEIERIQARCRDYESRFLGHVENCLAAAGINPARRSRRFQDSIEIMLGGKQVFLQQPQSYYFPGLPQIEYYEREDFAWVEGIEAATPAIREELLQVMADDSAFIPYVEADPNRPPTSHRLAGDPSWGAFHLWRGGEPVPGNADRCPATMAALARAPMPRIRGRSPMALFSRLKPGTHLAGHNGLLNTRLICHLPLIVPGNCALRVGNQIRSWEEGKMLIFDDSIEHEAWNRSNETRVILLFEIWRPEIDEAEREALTAMFEAITDYGGMAEE